MLNTAFSTRTHSPAHGPAAPEHPVPSLTLVPGAPAARPTESDATGTAENRRQQRLDDIVTSHLWLADSLARRFHHRGEDDQDLLQVARAGLVEASRRFDPDRGDFLAFAVPTVMGVLRRHFRDQGWTIRPPRRTQELAFEMRRGWPALVQALGTMPTEAHLADYLGATVADIREARCASEGYSAALLDPSAQFDGDGDQSRAEAQQVETRLILQGIWDQLDSGERDLIRLRFYEELSQVQIAAVLGTSQMQISRRLARLLTKLRSLIGDDGDSMAS